MEKELHLFCLELNHEKCIDKLRLMLSKEEQISQYDLIYENYHGLNDSYSIIPGLNRKIKFIALCKYYSDELFCEEENSKISEKWLLSLFNHDYSINSFLYTACQICDIRNRNRINIILTQYMPENRRCFPYVLLHAAGVLAFGSMVNLLFGNKNFTRIPIAFLFNDNETGPHGDRYEYPIDFFNHDLSHYYMTINSIKKYDINSILESMSFYNPQTIKRRILDVFIHSYIFEDDTRSSQQNINMFDDFNQRFLNIVTFFDEFDHKYIFSYLMKSVDIDDDIKLKYEEYKNNLSKIETGYRANMKTYDEFDFMLINNLMSKENFEEYENELFEKKKAILEVSSVFIKEFLKYLN